MTELKGVHAIGVILPDMPLKTKQLLQAFITRVGEPQRAKVEFEPHFTDVDGNPQTVLRVRWRK